MLIDLSYVFVCYFDDKDVVECVCWICGFDEKQYLLLLVCDLLEFVNFVMVDNCQYWQIKLVMLGLYVFILQVMKEVLCWLLYLLCKMIGLCVFDYVIMFVLLELFGQLLFGIMLILLLDDELLNDFEEICMWFEKQVDFVIDGGVCLCELLMVIDLIGDVFEFICVGCGVFELFGFLVV